MNVHVYTDMYDKLSLWINGSCMAVFHLKNLPSKTVNNMMIYFEEQAGNN